jgi:Flp pilus assembly pilin Flp
VRGLCGRICNIGELRTECLFFAMTRRLQRAGGAATYFGAAAVRVFTLATKGRFRSIMFRLLTDRRGVTSLEYALLAATLALAVMSALWVPASNMAALLSHILTAPGSGMHGG